MDQQPTPLPLRNTKWPLVVIHRAGWLARPVKTEVVMSFEISNLRDLRREAETLSERFNVGQDATAATYDGYDPTRSIRVAVDSGGRVRDVEVERSWRDSIDPRQLGASILAAANAATMERISGWAALVAEAPGNASTNGYRSQYARDGAPHYPDAGGGPTSRAARETMREMFDLLDGIESELDDLERRLEARVRQGTVGHGAGHHISVTLSGGQIANVEIVDVRWLEIANNLTIASEARSAFEAAHTAAKDAEQDTVNRGAIGALQALVGDPEGLLRRLGLLR
jgi:hypothetical protein